MKTNRSQIAGTIFFLGLVGLISADSLKFPKETMVVSDDGKFRLTIVPPRFTRIESYQAYRREEYILLSAAEGTNVALSASTGGTLLRKAGEGYSVIWARALTGNQIPRYSLVLSTSNTPIVICVGDYGISDSVLERFSVYNVEGRCVTNGFCARLQAPVTNLWKFDGSVLRLFDTNKHPIVTIPIS